MYSKSQETRRRRELNGSRTVKPVLPMRRLWTKAIPASVAAKQAEPMVAHHSVRQDKEKHAKSRNRGTGWTIACSMGMEAPKNPMQKSRIAEPAAVLRTA